MQRQYPIEVNGKAMHAGHLSCFGLFLETTISVHEIQNTNLKYFDLY